MSKLPLLLLPLLAATPDRTHLANRPVTPPTSATVPSVSTEGPSSDTAAPPLRETLPSALRLSYVRYGEQYLGQPWAALPLTAFARFKKDGNRAHYEGLCFERRRQLAALVMAEIMEGQDRFLPDIIDGLNVMMEETWWGIPAHYNSPVPDPARQTVDLFNAETASLVACAAHELRPQLQRFAPQLCQRLDHEIDRRLLRPVLGSKDWWKSAGMNWNPWITSNWLTCVLLCEHDPQRRQDAIREIQGCLRAFIDAYPDDGGCDEGTGYWDRAAASLYECLQLLRDAGQPLDNDPRLRQKVANMGAYIYKMYIGNDYCVNFADAHDNRSLVQLNVLYPFALYLQDPVMRQYAAHMARQKGFWDDPAALYDHSGNFPTLSRELRLLRCVASLQAEEPRQPQVSAWLPDLQILTARTPAHRRHHHHSTDDLPEGLFLAVKGGHNDESHNHNDVGSFIVYADGQPLLIDPGVGEYTSQTFGRGRYEIWTMQSQYHNLPQVNGCDQQQGRQHQAHVVRQGPRALTLELREAYPAEARIESWQRTVRLHDDAVELRDAWQLLEVLPDAPTRLCFMTPVLPDLTTPGLIRLGQHTLRYPATQATASTEAIDLSADPILTRMWGPCLHRISLTLSQPCLRGSIEVKVQ